MVKRILSVIAGITTGIIIVLIGDAITHVMFPFPEGVNINDKDALRQLMSTVPTIVLVVMFTFWILSSFLGGFVSGKINKPGWKVSSIVTGSILLVAAILNMFMLPHPLWMMIGSVILYIPAAYFGGKLAS